MYVTQVTHGSAENASTTEDGMSQGWAVGSDSLKLGAGQLLYFFI